MKSITAGFMKEDDEFIHAGEAILLVLDKIVPPDTKEYKNLYVGWEKIVGKEISYHVEPIDVVNHVLILEAEHPGWIMRIRMIQKDILSTIRNVYPSLSIKKISIHARDRATSKPEEKIGGGGTRNRED